MMKVLFQKLTQFLIKQMALDFQQKHQSLPLVFCGVHVAQSFIFCVVICKIVVYRFVHFTLTIVLSILLQFTVPD